MNIENNLNILTNLKKDDKLFIDNNELLINNEDNDFKLVNSYELCNNIVTTLLFTLHLKNNNKDNLDNIELIINNIYNNQELSNEIDNNEFFYEHLRNIENILEREIIIYKNNCCYRFFNDLFDDFLKLSIHVSRSIVNPTVINPNLSDDSDESEEGIDNSDNEQDLKED